MSYLIQHNFVKYIAGGLVSQRKRGFNDIRGGARVFAEGGGGGQNVSLLLREPKQIGASPGKSRSAGGGGGGGDSDTFLSDFKIFPTNCHNGVGVISSWP